ncbi:MAG: Yip1 family protein [Candidatus Pacearchaeota archaeon]|jgi:hypothetical protein
MGIKEIIDKAKEQGFSKKDIYELLNKKGYSNSEIDPFFILKKTNKNYSKKKYSNEFERLSKIITDPNEFFSNIKSESLGISLKILGLFCLGLIVIGFALNFILSNFILRNNGLSYFPLMSGFIIGVFMLIPGLIGLFILAFLIQGLLLLVKGDEKIENYQETLKVIIYSLLPSIALFIIPFVGFLSIIYSIVLIVIGLSNVHNISIGKAITALAIPLIVILAIIFLILIFLYFGVFNPRIF